MKLLTLAAISFFVSISSGCSGIPFQSPVNPTSSQSSFERPVLSEIESESARQIIENARHQLSVTTQYTQEYRVIPYPNGDMPAETGACTDVIIRAFRNAGIDLQKEVHEDMSMNFSAYPRKWGLTRPDTNIDHRRVPNLQTFFTRKGKNLPITAEPGSFRPGDVVTWDLDGRGMTHIGIVSNKWNNAAKRYFIIHNIGAGAKEEDRLFDWKITGHFRYF